MSLKIKVCGMKYEPNINAVSSLKPDYLGFIFYTKSQRFVGVEFDKNDIQHLTRDIKKTAVFVNAHSHEIKEFSQIYGIGVLQLHGQESPEFCAALKQAGYTIIKAFGLDTNFDFSLLDSYATSVDFFLFDTKTDSYGGSGKAFDWQVLKNYTLNIPFFLSGGLDINNLAAVKLIDHPQLYGVDLNSKFEEEPGLKNLEMLKEAFEIIRS